MQFGFRLPTPSASQPSHARAARHVDAGRDAAELKEWVGNVGVLVGYLEAAVAERLGGAPTEATPEGVCELLEEVRGGLCRQWRREGRRVRHRTAHDDGHDDQWQYTRSSEGPRGAPSQYGEEARRLPPHDARQDARDRDGGARRRTDALRAPSPYRTPRSEPLRPHPASPERAAAPLPSPACSATEVRGKPEHPRPGCSEHADTRRPREIGLRDDHEHVPRAERRYATPHDGEYAECTDGRGAPRGCRGDIHVEVVDGGIGSTEEALGVHGEEQGVWEEEEEEYEEEEEEDSAPAAATPMGASPSAVQGSPDSPWSFHMSTAGDAETPCEDEHEDEDGPEETGRVAVPSTAVPAVVLQLHGQTPRRTPFMDRTNVARNTPQGAKKSAGPTPHSGRRRTAEAVPVDRDVWHAPRTREALQHPRSADADAASLSSTDRFSEAACAYPSTATTVSRSAYRVPDLLQAHHHQQQAPLPRNQGQATPRGVDPRGDRAVDPLCFNTNGREGAPQSRSTARPAEQGAWRRCSTPVRTEQGGAVRHYTHAERMEELREPSPAPSREPSVTSSICGLSCPDGHPLTMMRVGKNAGGSGYASHRCDCCLREDIADVIYRCQECDYDCCVHCRVGIGSHPAYDDL